RYTGAIGSYPEANFIAGVVRIPMKVDAVVLVQARRGMFRETVEVDAIDDAGNGRDAGLCWNIKIRADFLRRAVLRTDGEEFVYEIGSKVHAIGRLDGSKANSARFGKVHRDWPKIAEAAIHERKFPLFQHKPFWSIKRDSVFFVGILQRS